MPESSEPLEVCRSEMKSRFPRQTWICEWEGIISPRRGIFLVEAGHILDANQTTKKHLRDTVLHSHDFIFTVRAVGLAGGQLPGRFRTVTDGVRRIVSFIRRMTVCKLGEHFNWKNHEPDRGIAGAGECLDCGVKWEGIKWPRPKEFADESSAGPTNKA